MKYNIFFHSMENTSRIKMCKLVIALTIFLAGVAHSEDSCPELEPLNFPDIKEV